MKRTHNEKILGIDYGHTRIGLAVAYLPQGIVFPKGIIQHTSFSETQRQLQTLINREHISSIVVGSPLSFHGTNTSQTKETTLFASQLREATHIPVISFDERLTTKLATSKIHSVSHKQAFSGEDDIAATILLEGYISSLVRE